MPRDPDSDQASAPTPAEPEGSPLVFDDPAEAEFFAKLPPAVQTLIRWRASNGLSQRAASEVLKERGLAVPLSTIKQWEQGLREPGMYARTALCQTIELHWKVENPPVYRPGRK